VLTDKKFHQLVEVEFKVKFEDDGTVTIKTNRDGYELLNKLVTLHRIECNEERVYPNDEKH